MHRFFGGKSQIFVHFYVLFNQRLTTRDLDSPEKHSTRDLDSPEK